MSEPLRWRPPRLVVILAIISAIWLVLPSGIGSAHSSLTDAAPAPDSRLEAAPSAIVLQFNERLENKGFAIQVYDRKGQPVTGDEAALDPDRRAMRLLLPSLSDGSYTVAYHLLSADGHPVRASYVFTVGRTTEANTEYVSASRLHDEHELGKNVPYWIARGLYYVGLLVATGWVGLRAYAPGISDLNRRRYDTFRMLLVGYHLLALLVLAWQDYGKLRVGFDSSERLDLLFGTSIGLSYAIAIPVALLGFWLTGRWRIVDAGWILLVFAAKGFNGHAVGYAAAQLTYILDVLHLTAASLWTGALLGFAIVGVKRLTESDGSDAALLSRAAFIAIAILAVSGLVTAALYTDGFDRLLDSQWGRLMLVKTGAVVLVIMTGACIRRSLRSGKLRRGSTWLLIDGSLFFVIVGITAVFTYLNPLAATGPVFWHEKVEGVHLAAIITPNKAGVSNQFHVSIGGWKSASGKTAAKASAQENEAPRKVTLRLQSINQPEIPPIDVPLAIMQTDGNKLSLYDYNYEAEGNYLSLPGKWKLEVRVQDEKLDEIVTDTTFYSKNEAE
ncbi:copper transport protein [Paenibacillus cellulosilyticus]|uniref:Copper transport protein n=1 Tax=Paenibacillus cellulosilyticus TaxID=375489 RepID=A0A2V2YS42_9BACL|nr:copper resistance protein CopC [Paenibacillus cellulosilyticus]PWV99475.1 copper transport protein [Paenibacillus cellulosilyticus]QKS44731.1 copper resistance protein CopC/CopD [Paenibacillus cellulosilyticus]